MSGVPRKVKNPLLSAAGQNFPFENFSGNTLLVPVTPATPAVLCDENEPPGNEVYNFVGQPPVSITTPLPEVPKEETTLEPPKQGFFTSIVSSFPNLSLSSNKSEQSKTSGYQEAASSAETAQFNPYPNVQTTQAPQIPSATGYSSTPYDAKVQGLQSQEANSASVNQLPPPISVPPSGGAGSYRLGNQRRLKYAPPPDLTSTSTKPCLATSDQAFPQLPSAPVPQSYLIPTAPIQSPDNSNSLTPSITISSSAVQSGSLQSSFRSSPVTSTNVQNLSHLYSSPQIIPDRVPEPATPQNTPANSNLSGFTAFRTDNHTSLTNAFEKCVDSENLIEPLAKPEANVEQNFAPISAKKVTEKLEHLIAERKNNSADSSPEVATIIARTDNQTSDELAEIDLGERSDKEKRTELPTSTVSVSSFFEETPMSHKTGLNFLLSSQSPVCSDTATVQQPTSSSVSASSLQQQLQHLRQSGFVPSSQTLNPKPQNVNFLQTAPLYQPVQSSYSGNEFFSSPISFGNDQSAIFNSQTSNFVAPTVPEPTGSATLSPTQMSVNLSNNRSTPDTVPASLQNLAAGTSEKRMQYRPVYQHWFFRKEVESKTIWQPFSMQDSLKLEEVHNSNDIGPETKVATDGGRYDVDILRRQRSPVYWTGSPNEVRRCSWFYKGSSDSKFVPYEENIAARLEEEYKQACINNNWNRRVDLNNGEYIIFHSPTIQVHYLQPSTPEMVASGGANSGSTGRPRVVKRGVDEFHIEDGEPEKVDHLLFLVHGIGSVCDLKFRTVEEVVDEFRSISLQLVQSHYRTAHEQGIVNRVEVLPVSWHATLHSEDTGIDKKLKAITLDSIPKLRHFTNDTLLDILFYTSPIYCQTIMETVGKELNRLFDLFKERNTDFDGGVYLGGHSLGSLILFDLLCHQNPPVETSEQQEDNHDTVETKEFNDLALVKPLSPPILKRKLSRKVSYVMGTAGTGQPFITYPQLNFHPHAFFALGSPIGMFVTVRGIDTLGENFALPTCPAFFNIFHPFDPVAYRVESLINPDAYKYRPKLIPHHKGRKRMHLELKETMARVGADLKQRLLDSVRSTWNSVYQLAMFHKSDNQTLEQEIDKVVEEQLNGPPRNFEQESDDGGNNIKVGILNGGRRIDYVLQEAPFEYINEYIFALSSHVCYWESEDTMLLILKEIYGSKGIQTDAQLPQHSLSIDRPSTPSSSNPLSFSSSNVLNSTVMGMDPTAPISDKVVGPPPTSGFVRKPTGQSKVTELHLS